MTKKSYTPEDFLAIQNRLNSSPDDLRQFLEGPSKFLHANGIEVSDEYADALEDNMREMQLGPKSFDNLAAMNKSAMGVGIAIRIRF